ncbi:MAG: hypothetical protein O7E57_17080, partial [Gammaproteobacteria bacterium]|nr:hypothetical protein [Gammaproteobacteria bacterium]
MFRVIRYLSVLAVSLVGVLTLLSGVVYLSSSWLISVLAPRFARTLGVEAISVTANRPGINSIEIETFRIRREGVEVRGTSGELTYDFFELLDGRFQSLTFATVEVTVDTRTNPADDTNTINPGNTPPHPAVVFAMSPSELTIDVLKLSVPSLGFVGMGSIQLSNGRLVFDMNGLQPAQAGHFRAEGEVADTGVIQLRFYDTLAPDD